MGNCVIRLRWSNYKIEGVQLDLPGSIDSHQKKKKKSKLVNGDLNGGSESPDPEPIYTKVRVYIGVVNLVQLGLRNMPRYVLFLLPLLKHGIMICFQTSFSSVLTTVGQNTLWKGNCWVSPSGPDSNVCMVGCVGIEPVSI